MQKKVAYLHVGTHKTGTTSIQQWLYDHSGMLLDLGVLVPRTGCPFPKMGGHHNLAWELSGDSRFREEYGTQRQLQRELASVCHEAIVLSSEDFDCVSNQPDVFKAFVDGIRGDGYDVNVVVYLRNPFDYAVSLYAEYKKQLALLETRKSGDFVEELRRKTDPEVFAEEIAKAKGFAIGHPLPCFLDFDYRRLIESYCYSAGGRRNVRVRAYSQDVVRDFGRLIGLSCVPGAGGERKNQSQLSEEELCSVKDALKGQWSVDEDEWRKLISNRSEKGGNAMEEIRGLLAPAVGFVPDRMTDISSWHGHLSFVPVMMQVLKPRVFVELGVHRGDSYLAFCQAVQHCNLNTKCFGVDTWKGDKHAGFYSDEVFFELKNYHDPRYSQFSMLLCKSFDEALNDFDDGSIDLLHIDGLHTYEAVTHDFDCWLRKLSDRSVVLFHDTVVRRDEFGVWKFWAELETRYPSFQFFHSNGLGILKVGRNLRGAAELIFQLEGSTRVAMRQAVYQQSGLIGAKVDAEGARNELEKAKMDAEDVRVELERAKADEDVLRTQLAAILRSRSWRVTAPMRGITAVLRRIRTRLRRT